MNWTPEQEAKLRDLWAKGISGGQIAKRMRLTRNTVIGKARRLGLAVRQQQTHRVDHAAKSDGAQLHMNGIPRDLHRADRLLRRFSWQDAE